MPSLCPGTWPCVSRRRVMAGVSNLRLIHGFADFEETLKSEIVCEIHETNNKKT